MTNDENELISTTETNMVDSIPPCNMVFHGNEQKEVGRITWSKGIVEFSGNVDESAKIFFEHLWRNYVHDCYKKTGEK